MKYILAYILVTLLFIIKHIFFFIWYLRPSTQSWKDTWNALKEIYDDLGSSDDSGYY